LKQVAVQLLPKSSSVAFVNTLSAFVLVADQADCCPQENSCVRWLGDEELFFCAVGDWKSGSKSSGNFSFDLIFSTKKGITEVKCGANRRIPNRKNSLGRFVHQVNLHQVNLHLEFCRPGCFCDEAPGNFQLRPGGVWKMVEFVGRGPAASNPMASGARKSKKPGK